ncbi:MAG: ABC transporter permease subunit [Sulfolobales archaeon]|jgi:NitT/TauT family transport system permease protein
MIINIATLLLADLLSTLRMFIAYIISLIIALNLGISMARNRYLESLLLPILDILQSIPILGFFPIALVVFINLFPIIGVEIAVIFLLITSLIWNMVFGIYSAVKSLDPSISDLVKLYKIPITTRFFRIYTPPTTKSIGANSIISWAGGWFFITSSEIIATGSSEYKVLGIGTVIIDAYTSGNFITFVLGLILLIATVLLTYLLLWNPLAKDLAGLNVLSIDSLYYKIVKPLVARIWDLIASLFESLEIKFRFLGRRISARGSRVLLLISLLTLILIFTYYFTPPATLIANLSQLKPVTDPNFYYKILTEILLSFGRVIGVILIGFLISIYLAYLTFKSSRERGFLDRYIVFIGEILASIPAILWWPILSFVASRGLFGVFTVSLIVFLQGSLWYTYFNILIYGLSSLKREYIELSDIYRVRGLLFIKTIFIPSMLPSIASGTLSSWGGAWNSTIVAEYIDLGTFTVDLGGVGAYLDTLFSESRFLELSMTIIILSLFIALINKTLWRTIFKKLTRRYIVE